MAGTYIEGVSKVLSGVYTLIKAAVNNVSLGARGTVAYPFTASWGPVNTLQTVAYKPEFEKFYGTALTAGKIAQHAFKAKPQKVLTYRMATSAAAKATVILNDGAATPAKSLELETLYPSTRPFKAVVKDGVEAGVKVIEIVENSVLLASVKGSDLATLEAELNKTDYVRVRSKGTTMPANTAGADFAGGNDGSAVTGTEYSAFLTTIEADGQANSFTLDAVTDGAIITTATDWTKRVRGEGLYITFVSGGPAAWDTTPADANTASKNFNYRGIINVGNGVDGFTAAEMAIFIAARAASVPLNRTLTDEIVDYKAVNKKLTPGQRVTAKEAGTLIFHQDGDVVVIDEGVNTLTTPPADETKEMGKIRVNNTLDQIARDLEKFGNEYKRTRSNTDEARQTYAATVENTYFQALAAMEVVQPGYFYRPDPQYHGKDAVYTAKIDEAYFHADTTPVDSMERIYQKINVNF